MMPTRIVLADEQPLIMAGVKFFLAVEPTFEVVGCYGSAPELVTATKQLKPHLVIMDYNLRGGGPTAARDILTGLRGRTRVVFLTTSEQREDVTAAIALGASGYMLKGINGTDLLQTMHTIISGETYIMPKLATRLLVSATKESEQGAAPMEQLTAREQQILKELSKGSTNKEIARQLSIAEKTVKHYMSKILSKMSARNRTEVVLRLRDQAGQLGQTVPRQ